MSSAEAARQRHKEGKSDINISANGTREGLKPSLRKDIDDAVVNFGFLVLENGKNQGYGFIVKRLEMKLKKSLKSVYEAITDRLYDHKVKLLEINGKYPLKDMQNANERKDRMKELRKETVNKINSVLMGDC